MKVNDIQAQVCKEHGADGWELVWLGFRGYILLKKELQGSVVYATISKSGRVSYNR